MIAPFYQTEHATLWHGDCLIVLPLLAAASVDLVLADLPYGTTACAWDSPIPLDTLWREYRRILKPRGAVVLTAAQPFTSVLIASNLEWFRYCWVWDKGQATDFANSHYRPMRVTEDVAVFSPADAAPAARIKMTYNPQGLTLVKATQQRGQLAAGRHMNITVNNMLSKAHTYQQEYAGYPTNVLRFSRDTPQLHPTQKPVALGRYLIRTYSNPGDVVLDNTMGVGSFVVAALEEGRRAIGIERAPDVTTPDDYCGIARDRVLAAEAAMGRAVPLTVARQPLQLGMALEAS